MKRFRINSQWRGEQFWILSFRKRKSRNECSAPLEVAQKVISPALAGQHDNPMLCGICERENPIMFFYLDHMIFALKCFAHLLKAKKGPPPPHSV
jgi:hypothetical protein